MPPVVMKARSTQTTVCNNKNMEGGKINILLLYDWFHPTVTLL
jgi:hypothetical protein